MSAPLPPPVAVELVGERLGRLQDYADLLADAGVLRGILGPREVPRLWDRHLLNCVPLADLLPRGCSVADVGSGAGLPGIVLAVLRPDVTVTLIESLARRVEFLRECVAELELANAEVWHGRAEEMPPERRWPVVTARAVAPLAELLPVTLPLLDRGGVLYAIKGQRAADEVAAARGALARWPVASVAVRALGGPALEPPTTLVSVQLAASGGSVSRETRGAGRGRARFHVKQRGGVGCR